VDDVLSEAMAPVLRDLVGAGITAPRIEDREWQPAPRSFSAMLWSPDGSGSGVWVSGATPESERVAMVADQVQEWVFEQLWSEGAPTNWPRCPRHPHKHPMRASTGDGVAVWSCPEDDVVIGPIGGLSGRGAS
jgi:hypothetical protein